MQKYAIEMGGVSRYFSKVSGSGVDVTLLITQAGVLSSSRHPKINSVQTIGALYKARLRKVHFSGDFLGVFDFLRIACSLGIPQENL